MPGDTLGGDAYEPENMLGGDAYVPGETLGGDAYGPGAMLQADPEWTCAGKGSVGAPHPGRVIAYAGWGVARAGSMYMRGC